MFSSEKKSVAKRRRLLQISSIKAKGLLVCGNGTTDAFVAGILVDLNGQEIKKEAFATQPQRATLNPIFKESFIFGIILFSLLQMSFFCG